MVTNFLAQGPPPTLDQVLSILNKIRITILLHGPYQYPSCSRKWGTATISDVGKTSSYIYIIIFNLLHVPNTLYIPYYPR
ncbi:hypothetical protein GDO78_009137 [Eleutherodactylus coqui]|uniref:Uncharacterized protein n=1 Tax=Eleutherodactylus coqui TaxID=57060 RepID=A0A8J6F9L4_ELECQ|nr:hypothetical protein GDO78_009137 [Eleutherodactylus coqui]